VKFLGALLLALIASSVMAATAYVSDELVLGVYAEQNNQGQRLATLHSGAEVETLSIDGEFTQVRLSDGSVGWVKSAFLTERIPVTVRVKQLEEELDRSRATTPALAEAAARSEVSQLQRELAEKQSELASVRAAMAGPTPAPGLPVSRVPTLEGPPAGWMGGPAWLRPWMPVTAVVACLAVGFCLGYATLARRIKRKFGGIKIY
jgi:hypothetical protein